LPENLVIVGGGAVAIEFATIAHALGARVTLVERSGRLISAMDAEMSRRLLELFEGWGIATRLGATVDHVTAHDGSLEVALSTGERVRPDTLLFAAGRRPYTEDLGLEAAGVHVESSGRIVVDEHLRTSAEGVYAAGDVLGPTLASIAMEQGRAAVCHAFGIPFEGTVDPTPVSAVYGMPEVAGAGVTEEECRRRGLDYEVGRAELELTPRGAIAGRGGLLKLVFLKDDRRVIGVHCIGDIASELIGIGQMAIRCGGTMHTIMNMSMATPTYSYAYKHAAFDGLARLAVRP
jgi:NAD(P) transhydrogenase